MTKHKIITRLFAFALFLVLTIAESYSQGREITFNHVTSSIMGIANDHEYRKFNSVSLKFTDHIVLSAKSSVISDHRVLSCTKEKKETKLYPFYSNNELYKLEDAGGYTVYGLLEHNYDGFFKDTIYTWTIDRAGDKGLIDSNMRYKYYENVD